MASMLPRNFQNWRGHFAIFGGILVLIPAGAQYSYGNIVPYIVSYFRYKGKDPYLTYQTASFILAIMILGGGLSMLVGGFIERRLGVRLSTLIGVIFFNSGIFASAWAITISFPFLVFTCGLMLGVGTGLMYIPPLVCATKWMPQRKGLINGILLAGFGSGASVINIVQTAFINPDNLAPDLIDNQEGAEQRYYTQKVVLDRVPFVFILQGTIFSIMQVIGIMLLGDPPTLNKRSRRYAIRRKEKYINEKSGILMNERPLSNSDDNGSVIDDRATCDNEDDEDDYISTSSAGEAATSNVLDQADMQKITSPTSMRRTMTSTSSSPAESIVDQDCRWSGRTLSTSEAIKDPVFWQIAVAFFMDNITISYMVSLYKAFGQTFIHDDLFLAAVGSCGSVFNGLGRISWGYIADRFSFKVSFMTLSAVMAALTFTFGLCVYGNKVMFFLWVLGIFWSIGGVYSTVPTVTSRALGPTYFGTNYGLVFLSSCAIPTVIATFTQQLFLLYLSWQTLFIIGGVFPAIGMIIAMFFNVKTSNGVDI